MPRVPFLFRLSDRARRRRVRPVAPRGASLRCVQRSDPPRSDVVHPEHGAPGRRTRDRAGGHVSDSGRAVPNRPPRRCRAGSGVRRVDRSALDQLEGRVQHGGPPPPRPDHALRDEPCAGFDPGDLGTALEDEQQSPGAVAHDTLEVLRPGAGLDPHRPDPPRHPDPLTRHDGGDGRGRPGARPGSRRPPARSWPGGRCRAARDGRDRSAPRRPTRRRRPPMRWPGAPAGRTGRRSGPARRRVRAR